MKNKIYIRSLGEWVTVPNEYFKVNMREHDTFRKRMKRCGECICPKDKFWLCDMDCQTCEFHTNGQILSLDKPINTGNGTSVSLADIIADINPSIEDIVSDALLIEELLVALEELDSESLKICKSIMHGNSERESAKLLNMNLSTFQRRWKKIKTNLIKKLEKF